MRLRTSGLFVLLCAGAQGGGCATQKQWTEWDKHKTHFASGDHLWFSVTNRGEKSAPRVSRADLQQARSQSWWGDQVVVRPRQVTER